VVQLFLTVWLQRVFPVDQALTVDWLRLKAQPTINALLFDARRKKLF